MKHNHYTKCHLKTVCVSQPGYFFFLKIISSQFSFVSFQFHGQRILNQFFPGSSFRLLKSFSFEEIDSSVSLLDLVGFFRFYQWIGMWGFFLLSMAQCFRRNRFSLMIYASCCFFKWFIMQDVLLSGMAGGHLQSKRRAVLVSILENQIQTELWRSKTSVL